METALKIKAAALRRQHILEAATRTFAETGYQRTTIRDVAKAAGVGDGTVYKSFASKADLLLALLDPLAEQMPPRLAEAEDMAVSLRRRWSDLTPEALDLLRTVLSEALVDRGVGDAFRVRVLDPAIEPLENALTGAGLDGAPLAARVATATFIGRAVLKILGDPVAANEGDAIPDRLAATFASMTGTTGAI